MTAQWEVFTGAFSVGYSYARVELGENALVRFDADQRLMATLANVHAPIRRRDKARIGWVHKHQFDLTFIGEAFALARLLARPFGEALQEALHFSQRVKAPPCEAFEGFLSNGRKWFVVNEQRAFSLRALIAITHRCFGNEVTLLDSCRHFLNSLATKLMSFQLAACCDNRFEKAPFRRLFKTEVQTVGNSIILCERAAERPVEFGVARKPLQVIEDHDEALAAIGAKVFDRPDHTRAFHEITVGGFCVTKDGLNRNAQSCRILTATVFLAKFSGPFVFLLLTGDAAINNGSIYPYIAYGISLSGGPFAAALNLSSMC